MLNKMTLNTPLIMKSKTKTIILIPSGKPKPSKEAKYIPITTSRFTAFNKD